MQRAIYSANYIGEKNRSGLKKVFTPGDSYMLEVDYHDTTNDGSIVSVRRQHNHRAEAFYLNEDLFYSDWEIVKVIEEKN